jgi:hypothetical protein
MRATAFLAGLDPTCAAHGRLGLVPVRIKTDSPLFRSSPPGLSRWPKNSDQGRRHAAIAAAPLQKFAFLGCRDKPGKDDQGGVNLYEAWYNQPSAPTALVVAAIRRTANMLAR